MRTNILKSGAVIMAMIMLTGSIISCSSTTMISSNPPGELYINGELKGTTPYKHSDTSASGAEREIVIKVEGYEDFNGVLKRNEQVNVGAVVGGVFFLFPFIWTMGYNPTHLYNLQPITP